MQYTLRELWNHYQLLLGKDSFNMGFSVKVLVALASGIIKYFQTLSNSLALGSEWNFNPNLISYPSFWLVTIRFFCCKSLMAPQSSACTFTVLCVSEGLKCYTGTGGATKDCAANETSCTYATNTANGISGTVAACLGESEGMQIKTCTEVKSKEMVQFNF